MRSVDFSANTDDFKTHTVDTSCNPSTDYVFVSRATGYLSNVIDCIVKTNNCFVK